MTRRLGLMGMVAAMAISAAGLGLAPDAARAGDGLTMPAARTSEPQRLKLIVGKSLVIDIPTVIRRASLSNDTIADTLVLTPRQIYLNAKTIGITNLTLWDEHGVYAIYDVDVAPDYPRLREQLRQILPTETAIEVWATHDHLTLTGRVTHQAAATEAAAIAEAYAPKKIINLLHVVGEPASSVELIKGVAASTVKFAAIH